MNIVKSSGKVIRTLTSGETFGEAALYGDEKRSATVKANSDKVICLALGQSTMIDVLGT